ncbi:MAG: hypothetical protein P9L92_05315 [Candidatus Electryonea clarkiae]|nr:hypothetical protein [Candidatus Electryonea clarkiae]
MRTQLRDKYIRKASASHGLYLVGWFNSDKGDPNDNRLPPKLSLDEMKLDFAKQAKRLTKDGVFLESKVLDISFPTQYFQNTG